MDNREFISGKWNDDESFDVKPPMWMTALQFAKERYEESDSYWEYNNGVEKKRIPYIEFVQNVIKIISSETNSSDSYLMAFTALARVREITGCSFENFHDKYAVEDLKEFPERNADGIVEYYKDIFNGHYNYACMIVLLAELLFTLRMERCPHEDWKKDIEYYQEIEKLTDAYLSKNPEDKQRLLCLMIKKQIAENCGISRNRNKTSEELFAGWDD